MIEGSLGLIVEGLVSILLVATIFYCISVNRKLERLRDEQKGMHQFIRELSTATTNADKAIQSLRATVQDSGDELAGQIDKGRNMNRQLKGQIDSAQQTMNKLVIMIGHTENRSISPSPPTTTDNNETNRHVANDLRRSMLGFEDLELEATPNGLLASDGLLTGSKGAL